MIGALSHQHSYNTVFKRYIECCASVELQCWHTYMHLNTWYIVPSTKLSGFFIWSYQDQDPHTCKKILGVE